ncbi:tyrosine-type recombinase/integrase [Leekyejoonella antrihumi]|uniref:Integrase n=1 Tax=Leekyejoonella antrihumi TaxID=1660198 RepID=A0A563DSX8_9MICO|nr:site-specific integrase [Leekyejoonella antrihumi]TWP33041.1 integrase [Leekyejoonella antrihumi]
MAPDNFFALVRSWLTVHLPRSRRLSPHTIRSYKTTLNLLLDYLRESHGLTLEQVGFDQIDHAAITGFTLWLAETRNAGPATVNQRLAAIKSFLAFCAGEDPALVARWLEIKQVRPARVPTRPPDALSMPAVEALIAAPGQDTRRNVRDTTLILLTFDAAARVQEILDLAVGDSDTTPGRGTVTLTGKGHKTRVVPIMDKTSRHLHQYTALFHPERPAPDALLFYTTRAGRHQQMSQDNVSYLLGKHAATARPTCPQIPAFRVRDR